MYRVIFFLLLLCSFLQLLGLLFCYCWFFLPRAFQGNLQVFLFIVLFHFSQCFLKHVAPYGNDSCGTVIGSGTAEASTATHTIFFKLYWVYYYSHLFMVWHGVFFYSSSVFKANLTSRSLFLFYVFVSLF